MGCCVSAEENFDYAEELRKQSKMRSVEVDVEEDERPDWGKPRRHVDFPDTLVNSPFPEEGDDAPRTVWSAFMRGVTNAGNSNCLGARVQDDGGVASGPYHWMSYQEVHDEVVTLSTGMKELGLQPQDTVGICSANRPEWTMTALANYANAFVTVALYDTLGANALEYILEHAECKVAFVSKPKLPLVLGVLDKCPKLRHIVMFDQRADLNNAHETVSDADRAQAEEHNIKLWGYSEVLEQGRALGDLSVTPAEPGQLAFIMYTSGTTGKPKGVMLKHSNLLACVGGVVVGAMPLMPSDVHLSYLPLAHIFETAVQVAVFCYGASIGFFGGNVRLLSSDIAALQPTIFAGVPRVFQRIYDKFLAGVATQNCIKRAYVTNALRNQSRHVRRGEPLDDKYDKKVFGVVRAKLGLDRCRVIVTGAAPCPPYLMEFLRAVLNPQGGVVQGYGMTETAAAVSLSEPKDHTLGHVGPPMPSAEIRLRDVPEMGYLHTNDPPTGEVMARGDSIFAGYYKNEEATSSTLTEDGWIATGDVGRWNPNGTLSIIDRKKNIFKLAQGEYVAAEKIEGVYRKSSRINQVFVWGDSNESFIVAIVVPDAEWVQTFATSNGWWGADVTFASPEFRQRYKTVIDEHRDEFTQAVHEAILEQSAAAGLLGYEKVRAIYLESEIDDLMQGFNVANDCLTPTFKLRRPFLKKRYAAQLDDLVAQGKNRGRA